NNDPGAAPNGADFVPLQAANGTVLNGRDLRSLSFNGSRSLPAIPLQWSVVTNDPDRNGNAVLWSGNSSNRDAAAITSVTVPPTEIKRVAVNNWHVKLIGFDERNAIALQGDLDGKFSFRLSRLELLLFSLFPKVIAVVSYDEPTEQVNQYAPYTLTVNGVVQP